MDESSKAVAHVIPSWRSTSGLPRHGKEHWAVWDNGKITKTDLYTLTTKSPLSLARFNVLIGSPGTPWFLPVGCVPDLQDRIIASIRAQQNYMTIVPLTILLLAGLGVLWAPSESMWRGVRLALIIAFFPAVRALDFYVSLRNRRGLAERSLFVYALQRSRAGFYLWAFIGVSIGAAQILAIHLLGSQQAVFEKFGMIYTDAAAGQWWRLITGPYLHYSLLHYGANLVLLTFAGWIVWPVVGRVSLIAFFLGNVIGAAAQLNFSPHFYDNFGGMSAGADAFFGVLVGACLANPRLGPKGFAAVFGVLAVASIVYSEVFNPHAATMAHVAGFGSGLALGAVWALVHRLWPTPAHSRKHSPGPGRRPTAAT